MVPASTLAVDMVGGSSKDCVAGMIFQLPPVHLAFRRHGACAMAMAYIGISLQFVVVQLMAAPHFMLPFLSAVQRSCCGVSFYAMYRSGSQAFCSSRHAVAVFTCAVNLPGLVPWQPLVAFGVANRAVKGPAIMVVVLRVVLLAAGLFGIGRTVGLQLGPKVVPLLAVPYMFSVDFTHCARWSEGICPRFPTNSSCFAGWCIHRCCNLFFGGAWLLRNMQGMRARCEQLGQVVGTACLLCCRVNVSAARI